MVECKARTSEYFTNNNKESLLNAMARPTNNSKPLISQKQIWSPILQNPRLYVPWSFPPLAGGPEGTLWLLMMVLLGDNFLWLAAAAADRPPAEWFYDVCDVITALSSTLWMNVAEMPLANAILPSRWGWLLRICTQFANFTLRELMLVKSLAPIQTWSAREGP